MGNLEKLQKIIANAGICSRRKAEELIAQGKVTVNGNTAQIGDKADIDIDEVIADGKRLEKNKELVYIMLNKPKGYVATAKDEQGRKNVTELICEIDKRLYPVGRLDMYSEGLLLMTNDGDFTYRMTHPSHELFKEYVVRIECQSGENPEKRLAEPMEIDGYKIAPPIVRNISQTSDGFIVSVKIREGRNRQIRKMCEECGYRVINLRRVAIGDLRLNVEQGKWRHLTQDELNCLNSMAKRV